MTMHLIFEEETIWVICIYAPQSGKPDIQKDKFYNELIYEWNMKGVKEWTLRIGTLMVMLEKMYMDLRVYMKKLHWRVKFGR